VKFIKIMSYFEIVNKGCKRLSSKHYNTIPHEKILL
jgi:hypothetical protein